MAQWGVRRRVMYTGHHEENETQFSSSIIEQNIKIEDETFGNESGDRPVSKKRKRVSKIQFGEKAAHLSQSKSHNSFSKNKQKNLENIIERWSADRYKLAEQKMFDVMKDLGATFTNPVSRPVLRNEARRHIGDTGLLDHLLKQMDGKVTLGGTERFRRCFNTSGIMEYWLENADLLNLRREAGVQDPHWISPNRLTPGVSAVDCSVSASEILELKAEITKLKRDMQELQIKKQEENNVISVKELVTWRVETDGRLNEITSYVKSLQVMLSEELVTWKTKVEQQLAETKSTLSSLAVINPPVYPCDKWIGDEVQLWFDDPDTNYLERERMVKEASSFRFKHANNPTQHLVNGREQDLLNDQRNMAELIPEKQEEEQAPITSDSSGNDNSKHYLDTSFLMLQELFDWKSKVERQLAEISSTVRDMQAGYGNGEDQNPITPCHGL